MYTCLCQVCSLSLPACEGVCACSPSNYVKATSPVRKDFSSSFFPVMFHEVTAPLMAKVASRIFSSCLKVRFYRYFFFYFFLLVQGTSVSPAGTLILFTIHGARDQCLRQIGLPLRRLGLQRPAVNRHMTAAMTGPQTGNCLPVCI